MIKAIEEYKQQSTKLKQNIDDQVEKIKADGFKLTNKLLEDNYSSVAKIVERQQFINDGLAIVVQKNEKAHTLAEKYIESYSKLNQQLKV